MALTRAYLKGMGLTDEQVSGIIEQHTETVDGLKNQIAQYKADAEKLPGVQAELTKAKEAAKNSGDAAKIQKDFDDYKAQVESEKAQEAKKSALRKVAKDAGLTEKGIEKAVKYTDLDGIELTEKGEVKDAKALIKSLREEWPEHIVKTSSTGADSGKPPENKGENGKYSSKDEIMKIKDPVQRQKAISENITLFTAPQQANKNDSTEGE